jgi:hypothetical protein
MSCVICHMSCDIIYHLGIHDIMYHVGIHHVMYHVGIHVSETSLRHETWDIPYAITLSRRRGSYPIIWVSLTLYTHTRDIAYAITFAPHMTYGVVWHMTYDIWHMICDIWHMTYDIWHMTYDMWHMTYDIWHMTYDMWHMTYDMWHDIWHMTYDIWYVTYDIWHMTYDMWHMTYDMTYDIWHVLCGLAWHVLSLTRTACVTCLISHTHRMCACSEWTRAAGVHGALLLGVP